MILAALLLLLLTSSHFSHGVEAHGLQMQVYINEPSSGAACNGQNASTNCLTLSELTANISTYLNSRLAPITLIFQPGQHLMPSNATLSFSNIVNMTLRGEKSVDGSIPVIRCDRDHGGAFIFRDADKVTVVNITLEGCGIMSTYEQPTIGFPITYSQTATVLAFNVTNLELDGVTILNGHGYGFYGLNVIGISSISNSRFINNTEGGGVYLRYVDLGSQGNPFNTETHSLTVSDTIFHHGSHKSSSYMGSGFSVRLDQYWYSVRFHLMRLTARHNRAEIAPNIHFNSASIQPNFIKVENCRCSHGTTTFEGGGGFQYTYITYPFPFPFPLPARRSVVEILNSNFYDNYGAENPNSLSELTSSGVVINMLLTDASVPHNISIRDSFIFNNRGSEGAGIHAQTIGMKDKHSITTKLSFEITRTTLVNNTCTVFIPERLSGVFLSALGNIQITNSTFVNNFGTGLLLESTDVYFSGFNRIENNIAHNGGGLALYGSSVLYFEPYTIIRLVGNKVDNAGGGIYVGKVVEFVSSSECFFGFYNEDRYDNKGYNKNTLPVSLYLHNNTAGIVGNDIYGGSLDTCRIARGAGTGARTLRSITDFNLDVTTKPSRVCLCNHTDGTKDCVEINKTISAYPGQTFSLSAIAVGQYLLTPDPSGTPSAVYASLLRNNETTKQGRLPRVYLTQESGRECRNFTYSIQSRNKYETIVLTVERGNQLAPYNSKLLNKAIYWRENLNEVLDYFVKLPVYVNVAMKDCPLGFEMSDKDTCDCAVALKPLGINCSIDDNTIYRKAPLWIGTETQTSPIGNSTIYLVHRHCPFDYCKPDNIDINLNDADIQCTFNRSGVLCGACGHNLSAILGGSQCRKCSNVYLLLLLPFLLAGVLLTVLLIATNLTVSIGTINGLIFFANIVKANQAIFYPHNISTNVLTVFVAWLNLDLGFNVCFFDGMDAYSKTWLQFVFPFYIWLLAYLIIIASRHSERVAKLCGKNIVQVLATLFLLSYAKLQRTITTGLAFTILDLSNNNTRLVWLYDSNVVYLHGIHIPLFIACISALLFLFVPYTLVILFGPCLQLKSHYKIFFWVGRLKPIFDAYLGPYKDRYRHWTGFLLLTRIVVLLLSAGNVLGDASINLVAIAIISYLLAVLVLLSGGVYRDWRITALECTFFINLGLLSVVTLYNRLSGGNQLVAIQISLSSSFITFCCILIYHVLVRLDPDGKYRNLLVNTVILFRADCDSNKASKLAATNGDHHNGGSVSEILPEDVGDKPQVRRKSTTDVTTIEISIHENELRDSILEDNV